jgi:hypothetical protein
MSLEIGYDDVVVIEDIHGEEEKCRVLWRVGTDKVRVKSLTRPHRDGFTVKLKRIIRNEGRRKVTGAL